MTCEVSGHSLSLHAVYVAAAAAGVGASGSGASAEQVQSVAAALPCGDGGAAGLKVVLDARLFGFLAHCATRGANGNGVGEVSASDLAAIRAAMAEPAAGRPQRKRRAREPSYLDDAGGAAGPDKIPREIQYCHSIAAFGRVVPHSNGASEVLASSRMQRGG